MAVICPGSKSRCSNIASLLSLRRAKKPFPKALEQTSIFYWLELIDINKLKSVTGEENGTKVTSDQDLPMDRSSLPFPHGSGVDTDIIRTVRKKEERKGKKVL